MPNKHKLELTELTINSFITNGKIVGGAATTRPISIKLNECNDAIGEQGDKGLRGNLTQTNYNTCG